MKVITGIMASALRLPRWVLAWVIIVLVPANLASLAFLGQPDGAVVAALAVGGMLPNIGIMVLERGVSRLMAFPHLLLWTPLVVLITTLLEGDAAGGFRAYLWILLAVDLTSLAFDYRDAWRWWRGDRSVA